MISEFTYPDRDWQLFVEGVDLEYFLKFVKKFEEKTKPIEQKKSFWHEIIAEFVLSQFDNSKVRLEFIDGIVTIMFIGQSDDISKKELKTIAEYIDNEIQIGSPNLDRG